jgi:hypothetical protein
MNSDKDYLESFLAIRVNPCFEAGLQLQGACSSVAKGLGV